MSRAATNICFLCERERTDKAVVHARAHADVRSQCTVLLHSSNAVRGCWVAPQLVSLCSSILGRLDSTDCILVSWDVTLLLSDWFPTLRTKAMPDPERSGGPMTQCHIPEDLNPPLYRCGNFVTSTFDIDMIYDIYDMIWYIWYDIFNCNWVATRWQMFSTHIHTNNIENVMRFLLGISPASEC